MNNSAPWRTDIQYYCSGKCGILECLRNYQEQYRINRTIKGLPTDYWESNCKWYTPEETKEELIEEETNEPDGIEERDSIQENL